MINIPNEESNKIEFKRCSNGIHTDTFETICAFANRCGGDIWLGVSDKGEIVGVPKKSSTQMMRNIINVVNNPEVFAPVLSLEVSEVEYQNKTLIHIRLQASGLVHRYKGIIFDRVGDVDVHLTGDAGIAQLYIRNQNIYTEQEMFPRIPKSELDLSVLDKVRIMAQSVRNDHPWRSLTDDELLRSAKLLVKNPESERENVNLAAVLLFGSEDLIFSVCPTYKTDAILRIENLDRYDDREIVRANLLEAYLQLVGFCSKHLPSKYYLEGTQAINPRDMITRELIANSLMHREYSSPFPAKLIIDQQGIHTENASRSFFEGNLRLDAFNPIAKNPIIANFFIQIGIAEELGSGMRNLYKFTKIYSDSEPLLIEGSVFYASIPTKNTSVNTDIEFSIEEAISAMLDKSGYATTSGVASLSKKSVRTVRNKLSSLVQNDELVRIGSTNASRYFRSS